MEVTNEIKQTLIHLSCIIIKICTNYMFLVFLAHCCNTVTGNSFERIKDIQWNLAIKSTPNDWS